ncbi:MAG: hypothetical protein WBB28_23145 [Crinalium sp.]
MNIIRQELDGAEFFTVEATGESGMSYSGLAILCGLHKDTISSLLQNLSLGKAPKRLQYLLDKDLHLSEKFIKRGGKVKILRSNVCAAIIKHYAFEGHEKAEFALDRFNSSGIETWIQNITGWKHQELQPQTELGITNTLSLLNTLLDPLISKGVDVALIQSAKMSAIALQHPEYQPMLKAAKEALTLMTPDSDRRYSPTRLGEMYAQRHQLQKPITPQSINQALYIAGLQTPGHRINSKGKKVLEWSLTDAGEKYGKVLLESGQHNNKTITVIRWLPSVLDAIKVCQG